MRTTACPACRRRVINRRLARCEFCSAPLPLDALMSADELDASETRLDEREKLDRKRRASGDCGENDSNFDFLMFGL